MSYDPQAGFPRVVPALLYEDAGAAIGWLTRVFGLNELLRWEHEDGSVGHADMELEGGIVMLEGAPENYRNPARDGHVCKYVLVYVDDLDGHFENARAAGATIVSEPEDKPWGLRQYLAKDLEGHTWEFTQHIRDVPPEDWGAVAR